MIAAIGGACSPLLTLPTGPAQGTPQSPGEAKSAPKLDSATFSSMAQKMLDAEKLGLAIILLLLQSKDRKESATDISLALGITAGLLQAVATQSMFIEMTSENGQNYFQITGDAAQAASHAAAANMQSMFADGATGIAAVMGA